MACQVILSLNLTLVFRNIPILPHIQIWLQPHKLSLKTLMRNRSHMFASRHNWSAGFSNCILYFRKTSVTRQSFLAILIFVDSALSIIVVFYNDVHNAVAAKAFFVIILVQFSVNLTLRKEISLLFTFIFVLQIAWHCSCDIMGLQIEFRYEFPSLRRCRHQFHISSIEI